MESKWVGRSRALWAGLISFLPVILTGLCGAGVWCAPRGFLEGITSTGTAAAGVMVGGLALVARFKASGLTWPAIVVAGLTGVGQALAGTQTDPALSQGFADFSGAVVAFVSGGLLLWHQLRPDTPAGPAPLTIKPPSATAP